MLTDECKLDSNLNDDDGYRYLTRCACVDGCDEVETERKAREINNHDGRHTISSSPLFRPKRRTDIFPIVGR